ncbi:MAG: glycosyltransferase family 39 protein [Acidobacteriota bacterium]|nr:glycosyltransferase family 39 protein [Acidobacteriota bacterium]
MIVHFLRKISVKTYNSIALFLLAFALRSFYCIERVVITPDSKQYINIAKNLYFYNSFAFSGDNGNLIPTAFRPLLYPFFIAVINGANKTYENVLFVQCVLGAATVVLIYLIAYDSFGCFVALISALMLAFGPLTIHFTATILTETLFTFLLISGIYFWGKRKFYLTGIMFGLAALAKPIIFPFLFFLVVLFIFSEIRKEWKNYLIIIVFAFIISAPWMIRNSMLFNRITLTQSSGFGTNLLVGTIESPLWGNTNRAYSAPILKSTKKSNEIEQDRSRFKIAINRIIMNPLNWIKVRFEQYPRLFLDSGDYLLGEYNVAVGEALKDGNFLLVVFKITFILANLLFYSLAVIGFIFAGKKIVLLPHIFLFPIFLALLHIPMWIETRYFLPAVPLVCIISAFGIQQILIKQNIINLKRISLQKNMNTNLLQEMQENA